MNILRLTLIITLLSICTSIHLYAQNIFVDSQASFDNAHDSAGMNDTIVWRNGTYSNIFMDIDNDNLYIMAETLGEAKFTGGSKVDITSDYITLKGLQFIGGDVGSDDVINTRGSYNIFTQININAYESYKYLRVRESSQYCEITYCNFENRLNLDDQNILSILVDDENPGYHKIQYCSFKNFAGTGNDLGIEPIRIGVSTQADYISRTLVEHCYFTQCNGDGELISSKARQNVYRYNTFENNPVAELVLRHGSENIVYGNFFLNGKGGVRVREGQDHYIYNNYFYRLNDRPIYLQNESSDPLDNINIAFNTIISCAEVRLGGDGSFEPTRVTFANNILSDPDDDLFEQSTDNENWIGNIAFGSLGIDLPTDGITVMDPQLSENGEGFFGLGASSPAIDAAQSGFDPLPEYEGIENIDSQILLDIMGQNRPSSTTEKDLGCNEFPHNISIQPLATEANTGPTYNTDFTISTQSNSLIVSDLISIQSNPVSDQINLKIYSEASTNLEINLYDMQGKMIANVINEENFSNSRSLSKNIESLPAGVYIIKANSREKQDGRLRIQSIQFNKF